VQKNLVAYIRASAGGDQRAANEARDRAVDSLARVANISPDEARARLGQVEQQYRQTMDQAKQQATQAAEGARRSAARAGLVGFVALVLGAVAAWFGGGIGTPRPETARAGTRRPF
jgi:CHASE3 domain sensor protein